MGKYVISILVIVLGVAGATLALRTPANDRNWRTDQAVLPHATIEGQRVTVHNIRNFRYHSATEYVPGYYDKTFDVEKLKAVYFLMEPFADERVGAHTMLSFEFEDDSFLTLSVEARREQDVPYSAWRGLWRRYEVMYILADEQDMLPLRANHRANHVYMYPAKADLPELKELFMSVIHRVNELYEQPEFYNTLFNNCTTSLVDHVNALAEHPIRWHMAMLFTERSDALAVELGLLAVDEGLPINELRKQYRINEPAALHDGQPTFSQAIRARLPRH
jgi:hypothetical protein